MKKFFYLIIILVTAVSLFILGRKSVRHFPSFISKETYNYKRNYDYKMQIMYYPLCSKQSDIVMLGNSLMSFVKWNEFLQRDDIANRGVAGDISAGCLSRIGSVIKSNPKICFVECGINDIIHHIPAEETINNLKQITDSLKYHNIRVVIHKLLYVARQYPDSRKVNEQVKKLNELISEIKGAEFFDLNPLLSVNEELQQQFCIEDGIHLTVSAYNIWRDEMKPFLK